MTTAIGDNNDVALVTAQTTEAPAIQANSTEDQKVQDAVQPAFVKKSEESEVTQKAEIAPREITQLESAAPEKTEEKPVATPVAAPETKEAVEKTEEKVVAAPVVASEKAPEQIATIPAAVKTDKVAAQTVKVETQKTAPAAPQKPVLHLHKHSDGHYSLKDDKGHHIVKDKHGNFYYKSSNGHRHGVNINNFSYSPDHAKKV